MPPARSTRSASAAGPTALSPQGRVYALVGPEPMLQRLRLEEIRENFAKVHGPIEPVTFDGKTVGLADVFDELRTLSLLSPFKIVVVDAAADFVKTHRQALERYAQAPSDSAVLVLRSETWNRGNLDKLIEKQGGAIVRCDPMKRAEAAAWLTKRAVDVYQAKLPSASAGELVNRLGSGDLGRLDSELAKLSALAGPSQPISVDLIDQIVGRSSDEEAWAVQDAFLNMLIQAGSTGRGACGGGVGALLVKLRELVELSGQPETLVHYFVADVVRKLSLAAVMMAQGLRPPAIAPQLKLWGPRQALFFNALGRVKTDDVLTWFTAVLEADRRTKQGRGEAMLNLECYCVQVADEARG
ncbi:MAG: hypothetical protein IT441_02585 [Phycisphaeraceae bacterium]|nr:hypothetical protein [Phycisphaeraceae bacterium]